MSLRAYTAQRMRGAIREAPDWLGCGVSTAMDHPNLDGPRTMNDFEPIIHQPRAVEFMNNETAHSENTAYERAEATPPQAPMDF